MQMAVSGREHYLLHGIVFVHLLDYFYVQDSLVLKRNTAKNSMQHRLETFKHVSVLKLAVIYLTHRCACH